MGISDEAVSTLLSITDGHPHDTQKLGYFTWAAAEEEDIPADRDTVELALATAIATDTARYTELWDGLTTNQRRLLEAIGALRLASPCCQKISEPATNSARTRPSNAPSTHWWNAASWSVRAEIES